MTSSNCNRSAGYYEEFDTSMTNMPYCWSVYNSDNGFFSPVNIYSNPPSVISAPNFLDIFSNGIDTAFAISPRFTDLPAGNKIIDFFAKANKQGEELIIGSVDTTTGTPVFTPIDTVVLGISYQEYIIAINSLNYNGSDHYLALRHGGLNPYHSIQIDNFRYDNAPACPKAINPEVSYIGDTAVVITINDTSSVYNFVWGPPGFSQATAATGTGSSPFTIHPLNPDADYEFMVATNCQAQSNGNSSFGFRYQFQTLCSPTAAAYHTDFDNDTNAAVPACWTNVLQGDGTNSVQVHLQQRTTAFSSPHLLWMYKAGNVNPGNLTMTCTPAFSDLDSDEHQIRLLASSVRGTNALLIGTVSSPADPGSFVLQDSIYLPSSNFDANKPTYQEIIVALDTALIPSNHQHVALKASRFTDDWSYLYIDNFHYEDYSSCQAPALTDINLVSVDSSTAEIEWLSGQGLKTLVMYGAKGFLNAGQSYDTAYTTGDSIVLTGLASNMEYDIYLVDSCAGGYSYWAGPFSFVTNCSKLMAPYAENFDGPNWGPGNGYWNDDDLIDNCWRRTPENASNYTWSVGSGYTPSNFTGPDADVSGSGNYIFIHSSLGNMLDTALIFTPTIDISGLSEPYLEFYFHRYGSNMTDLFVECSLPGGQWHQLLQVSVQPQLGHSSPYSKIGVRIPDTLNTTQIRFRAVSAGFGGSDIALDEISIDEAPSCPLISDVNLLSINDTSASFSWDSTGSGQSYQLWLGEGAFWQGAQTTGGKKGIVAGTSFTVDTLKPDTDYQILVKAICGPGDSSTYSYVLNFHTLCSKYNAPYFTDFDTDMDGEDPACWATVARGPSAQVHVYNTSNAYSEPNCLYMNNGDFANVLMAVSPAFSDLPAGNARIRMRIKRSANAPEVIYVGTASYPFSDSTFHPIDTLTPDVVYTSYIQEFTTAEGYNGTDENIAFMHGNTNVASFNFREIFIDDFHYEPIPACKEVDDFTADTSAVSDSLTILSWTANGSSSYLVEYGPAGFIPGSGTFTSTTYDSLLVALPPLNVPYDFYIYSVCGNDTGYALGPRQAYGPPSTCDDFEAYNLDYIKEQSSLFQPNSMSFFTDVSEVSDLRSYSGSQSLHMYPPLFWGNSSSYADFDDLDSGSYSVSLAVFVESYARGNYAIFREYVDGFSTTEEGFVVNLENSGTGYILETGGSGGDTAGQFSFAVGQWNYYQHIIDLDNDTTWLLINGVDVNVGWQYTFNTPGAPSKIAAVGFAAWTNHLFGSFADDYFVDDFCIRPYKNCFTTSISSINSLGCDEVELLLADTVPSIIEYGMPGFAPGSGTQLNSSSSPMLISGLQAGTEYEFYNYSICANGDTSYVEGPVSVTTDSLPLPQLQVSTTSTYGANDKTIDFDASASVDADYVVWDYSNGVSDTGFVSSQSYTSNGLVNVVVTAYNACAAVTDTLSLNIDISTLEHSLSTLSVYPNPLNDKLNISLMETASDFVNIRLVDARGQVILEESHQNPGRSFEHSLSIGRHAAGVYMLVVETEQGRWIEQLQKF